MTERAKQYCLVKVLVLAVTMTETRAVVHLYNQIHSREATYLCLFHFSGESSFLVLSSDNAVERWRNIIGPTDPDEAKEKEPKSLRSKLGKFAFMKALELPPTPSEPRSTYTSQLTLTP